MVVKSIEEPTMQFRMIQRYPKFKHQLVITEKDSCQECGEQINKNNLKIQNIKKML